MEEEQKNEEQTAQPAGKKKSKFMLMLLIIILALSIGAGGIYFFFGDRIMQKHSGAVEGKPGQKKDKKEISAGPILSLEPFLFNIVGTSKFAKVTLGLGLKEAKTLEEAKKAAPAIRDRVLSVLGTKGPDILLDVNSRNAIKQELQDALKSVFHDQGDITAVYITDIIIQ